MATHITLDQLIAANACRSQREEFSRLFPTGKARVTIKRAVSLASVFDWYWAAKHLLTPEGRAAYEAATSEAWVAYRAAYQAAKAEAFARAYLNQ